ncbi:MAG: MBOAT family protein [Candidatus Omnitrophica bacterium]|nr:MBOAT family protein [Candidatus Omnitrophota bacterium]
MLFNSYEFIFLFLPVVLIGFFGIGRLKNHRAAILWLVAASLFFYGWWNPVYLCLILGSIVFNYTIGAGLASECAPSNRFRKKIFFVTGITGNLLLLCYFKYAHFFLDTVNALTGTGFHLGKIVLPLAISFFTFQQIAYLADVYRGETYERNFLHYCLFVTFFPQLIAGPIVHHKEVLPQFAKNTIYKVNHERLALGITIFCIGLFKKVVLADGIAAYASPVFAAAEHTATLTFLEAWCGTLAYTFQIYFDFSAYSDMAIGLGQMFDIRLPLNFHSPYKALSIIEFWKRWHITLSRFLRDYLYIPLGGNRKGSPRRYLNILVTMVLGGLWHGAGWTFVIWGTLHGVYIVANHLWRTVFRSLKGSGAAVSSWWERALSHLTTFTAVVIAWVFFRAESFTGAVNMLAAMSGKNGIPLPGLRITYPLIGERITTSFRLHSGNFMYSFKGCFVFLLFLFIIAWFFPSTQEFTLAYQPALETYSGRERPRMRWLRFTLSPYWAVLLALLSVYAIINISSATEFIYFTF